MKKYDEPGQSEKTKEIQAENKEEYVIISTDSNTFENSGKTLLILFWHKNKTIQFGAKNPEVEQSPCHRM